MLILLASIVLLVILLFVASSILDWYQNRKIQHSLEIELMILERLQIGRGI